MPAAREGFPLTSEYCVIVVCDHGPDVGSMTLQLYYWFPFANLPDLGRLVPTATNSVANFCIYVQGADLICMPNHKTISVCL